MKNMRKISLFFTLIILVFTGCQKDLLDTTPYDQLSSENMWTTDNLTDLGVNSIYEALRLGQNTGSASGLELYHYDRFAVGAMQRVCQCLPCNVFGNMCNAGWQHDNF